MLQKKLFVKAKNKMKMKKNAFEPVNFEEEKKRDPKYKTELCKSWVNTNFCSLIISSKTLNLLLGVRSFLINNCI